MDKRLIAFKRLLNIMDDLREKCPWDRKQTMQTLRNLTIEETYELADAILEDDVIGVEEEVGDRQTLEIEFQDSDGKTKKMIIDYQQNKE